MVLPMVHADLHPTLLDVVFLVYDLHSITHNWNRHWKTTEGSSLNLSFVVELKTVLSEFSVDFLAGSILAFSGEICSEGP